MTSAPFHYHFTQVIPIFVKTETTITTHGQHSRQDRLLQHGRHMLLLFRKSADLIRSSISRIPVNAIHFIGTGDYHYQTLFWLERLKEPFTLILIDHHPDDQAGAFGDELLSCGGWVTNARALPLCRKTIWIHDTGNACHTRDRHKTEEPGLISETGPELEAAYLSVDIDVLSTKYAHTDWSQGEMTLDELLGICRDISSKYRLLGADICGGLSEENGGTDSDQALNYQSIKAIAEAILQHLDSDSGY